ncbi:hypothetical protein [Polyangium aurulentum]|uniref:hypothetical protein n=1 Tax=Polyangium aurulentum TaxID=2567896 RepID=UPI0010ADE69C|nr:hypothetical protein [Polyangium aurulentum]
MPLPSHTFIPCSSCGCHARASESQCPHCGAAMRTPDGAVARTKVAVLMGLTAAMFLACGDEGSPSPGPTSSSSSSQGSGGDIIVGGAYGGGPSVGGGGGTGGQGSGGDISVGGAYGGGPSVGGAGGTGGQGGQ